MKKVGQWFLMIGVAITLSGLFGDIRIVRNDVQPALAFVPMLEVQYEFCLDKSDPNIRTIERGFCDLFASEKGFDHSFIRPCID